MKEFNKQRGITLIALVITVIVLLILAGISISALTGENGILSKSKKAKLETSHGAVKEAVITAYNEYILELEEVKEKLADEYNNRYNQTSFNSNEYIELVKTELIEIDEEIYNSTFLSYCEYKGYLDEYIKHINQVLPELDTEIGVDGAGVINVPNLVGHDTGYGKGINSDGYLLIEGIEVKDEGLGYEELGFNNSFFNLNKAFMLQNDYNIMKIDRYIPPYREASINYTWRLYYLDKKRNKELLYELSDVIDIPVIRLDT